MADADNTEEVSEETAPEGAEAEGGKRKLGPKTLALFVGAPVMVIAVVVGALFVFGVFGGGEEMQVEADTAGEPGQAQEKPLSSDPANIVFYDMPEIVTNLNSESGPSFLKLSVALELDKSASVEDLETIMPRVVDQFQVYLRELRLEDLSGSAGMILLKEELLHRVNLAADPIEVRDVLFKEMIVQ